MLVTLSYDRLVQVRLSYFIYIMLSYITLGWIRLKVELYYVKFVKLGMLGQVTLGQIKLTYLVY